MRLTKLIRLSLAHYWQTNLAVVVGVAITVTVLTGALLVGDSVRGSLRDLVLERLGNTAYVISSAGFFREALASELEAHTEFGGRFRATAPLIALESLVTHEPSRRRASSVLVYGVDERFWQFHEQALERTPNGLALSAGLAEEFGAAVGDSILVRVQRPSAVPADSLHGRKNNLGRSLRFTLEAILLPQELGEFSLRPQQGTVRAVFLPLERLQRSLAQEGKVNTILVSAHGPEEEAGAEILSQLVERTISLEDLGLKIRSLEEQSMLSLESDRILIPDRVAAVAQETAEELGLKTTSVFSYLANTIRAGAREIPYSLVAALAPLPGSPGEPQPSDGLPPLWLNDWAFRDLQARPGETVTLEYYVWEEGGELRTESAQFRLQGSLPMRGLAVDRDLAPDYPGITDSNSVSDWDPPFPIDLTRIRPRDEDYWERYRAAPKAILPLEAGQRLWRSRYGQLTTLRLRPGDGDSLSTVRTAYRESLAAALNPVELGFAVQPARAQGAQASQGAVNFGEYFFYFSFFLVVSAVLLSGLFFRLGVEQRLREIGLLQAVGFPRETIRNLFVAEGLALAFLGSLAGMGGAVAYGWLLLYALRTWWVDAVGTTLLALHLSWTSLLAGGLAGVLAALIFVLWTLRGIRKASPRSLLAGTLPASRTQRRPTGRALYLGGGSLVLGLSLLVAAASGWISQVAGFFGSGTLLLVGLIAFMGLWLSGARGPRLTRAGRSGLARLGIRNASWRPGRSLVSIALVASATFILVAVESFRHREGTTSLEPNSGTGGFLLLAESLIPLPYDLNTAEGRDYLGLSENEQAAMKNVGFTSFRLRPGEDASCLNLYQPQNPRILGVPGELVDQSRFAFQDSLAQTAAEQENPWKLLEREFPDGAIPAIVDANTMTYVLHLGLGDDFVLARAGADPIRLRLAAALTGSIFQSEILISEANFLRLFPQVEGFRFFLLDLPPAQADTVAPVLEDRLSDLGFDVRSTGERLATYHRVENTYLSTFQALGGLGLLLGTLGLAAILLRNVLERRRELALLRAVGYRKANLALLVLVENALLLAAGLAAGIGCALLAIAPALAERGGQLPLGSLGLLLLAVFLTGLTASVLTVAAVIRAPLVPALRTE